MNIADIGFIIYINLVPLGLIAMGCYVFYLAVLHEHNKRR